MLSSLTWITVQCYRSSAQMARYSQRLFYICTHSDVQPFLGRMKERQASERGRSTGLTLHKTIFKESQAKWPEPPISRPIPQIVQSKTSLFSLPSCIELFRRVHWHYINILSVQCLLCYSEDYAFILPVAQFISIRLGQILKHRCWRLLLNIILWNNALGTTIIPHWSIYE